MPEHFRIRHRKYDMMKLGEGSFVEIYRGFRHNRDTDDSLLIKILAPRYRQNEIVTARFIQEFNILKDLATSGEYFVQKPIRGKSSGAAYLAYNFIEGETVLSLLKRHDPALSDVMFCCEVMRHLLRAIDRLHRHPRCIVHSDISPENILLNGIEERQPVLWLIDMGCSQYIDKKGLADKWVGKPSYLSPEQARGEGWNQKSDLYQAGIVFYEMLTKERWNQGATQKEKVVFASSPTPTDYSRIPIKLRPLLRSMLGVDSGDRLESAALGLRRLEFAISAL